MSNFIKLTVQAQNQNHDTVVYARKDVISRIGEASFTDKSLREGINAVVEFSDGRAVAVVESAASLLKQLDAL